MEPRSVPKATTDAQKKMKQLLPIKHAKGFEFRWEEAREEKKEDQSVENEVDQEEAKKGNIGVFTIASVFNSFCHYLLLVALYLVICSMAIDGIL